MRISQLISIAGAVLVLGAFAALQFRRTHAQNRTYLLANAFGSAFLATAAGIEGLWAFVTLNTVWGLVSLRSLFRTRRVSSVDAGERPPAAGPSSREGYKGLVD